MSQLETTNSVQVVFHRVTPVLRVNDLEASLNYYVGVLGFKMNWRDDDGNSFASVSRGDCHLFLSVGDQGNPGSWMWIGVSDVDALHEELKDYKDGFLLEQLAHFSNKTASNGWIPFTVTAQSSHAGQTILLNIRATNAMTKPTTFFVDTLSLVSPCN